MEKIFLGIVYSVGFMIFIGVIFHLIEKYLGITAVPKYGGRSASEIQRTNDKLLEYEQKNNPILVKFAINNVEKNILQ
ncbi:hypothetical protein [Flavobacterium sp.]|jgi:hypothetical protein|uniref:hypothetical protein n=1 Tax=Flavobacterium sp. TaxID=239 RepID=UPI0037BE35B0